MMIHVNHHQNNPLLERHFHHQYDVVSQEKDVFVELSYRCNELQNDLDVVSENNNSDTKYWLGDIN